MKIETLKPQFCQQGIGADGVCGEVAYYRVTLDESPLSVAYCKDHALNYLNGKKVLAPIPCAFCRAHLRPGYFQNSLGQKFCTETEMYAYDGSATGAAYR